MKKVIKRLLLQQLVIYNKVSSKITKTLSLVMAILQQRMMAPVKRPIGKHLFFSAKLSLRMALPVVNQQLIYKVCVL